MRYLEELPFGEIAAALDLGVGAVKMRHLLRHPAPPGLAGRRRLGEPRIMTDPNVGDVSPEAGGSEQVLADWAADCADRLQAEEHLDLEAYAREHPERVEHLRRMCCQPLPRWLGLKGRPARVEILGDRLDGPGGAERVAFGDFSILREIGRGGMGVVYQAVQVSLNRHVASRCCQPPRYSDLRRLQEVPASRPVRWPTLSHPSIVPIYSVGHDQGTPLLRDAAHRWPHARPRWHAN